MMKTKLLASILLMLAVLFAQVGSAAAAPQTQDGTVTLNGIVTEMLPQTDGTVLVTVTAADQTTTIVHVSAEVAAGLTVGQPVPPDWTVPATDVVPPEETEPVHPISQLLSDFFFNGDPAMAAAIDSWHNGDFTWTNADGTEQSQVFGFGVIAQALWMATTGEGDAATTDATLAGQILQAKKTGDYSTVAAALGLTDIPTNWGQFKKALKGQHENLGAAVSSEKGNKPDKEKGKPDKPDKPDKDKGKPNK